MSCGRGNPTDDIFLDAREQTGRPFHVRCPMSNHFRQVALKPRSPAHFFP
jgi:hypothetical protein